MKMILKTTYRAFTQDNTTGSAIHFIFQYSKTAGENYLSWNWVLY